MLSTMNVDGDRCIDFIIFWATFEIGGHRSSDSIGATTKLRLGTIDARAVFKVDTRSRVDVVGTAAESCFMAQTITAS